MQLPTSSQCSLFLATAAAALLLTPVATATRVPIFFYPSVSTTTITTTTTTSVTSLTRFPVMPDEHSSGAAVEFGHDDPSMRTLELSEEDDVETDPNSDIFPFESSLTDDGRGDHEAQDEQANDTLTAKDEEELRQYEYLDQLSLGGMFVGSNQDKQELQEENLRRNASLRGSTMGESLTSNIRNYAQQLLQQV